LNIFTRAGLSILRIVTLTSVLMIGSNYFIRYLLTKDSTTSQIQNIKVSFIDPTNKFKLGEITSKSSENHVFEYAKWNQNEKDFINLAFQSALSELHKPETISCIAQNTTSYPIYKHSQYIDFFIPETHPFLDIFAIRDNKQTIILYNSKSIDDDHIAMPTSSELSIALKKNRIDSPMLIYISKSNLDKYVNDSNSKAFGGYLVHEILHHYNHDHPGETSEEKYENKMFINTTTECIGGLL
jgi:hypothetical protein